MWIFCYVEEFFVCKYNLYGDFLFGLSVDVEVFCFYKILVIVINEVFFVWLSFFLCVFWFYFSDYYMGNYVCVDLVVVLYVDDEWNVVCRELKFIV